MTISAGIQNSYIHLPNYHIPCPKDIENTKKLIPICRWREENERNDGSKILEDMVDYMEVAFQIEPPRDKKSEPVKKKFGFA